MGNVLHAVSIKGPKKKLTNFFFLLEIKCLVYEFLHEAFIVVIKGKNILISTFLWNIMLFRENGRDESFLSWPNKQNGTIIFKIPYFCPFSYLSTKMIINNEKIVKWVSQQFFPIFSV